MSEVMPNAQREFWSPPAVPSSQPMPPLAGACEDCGSEFMVEARFCHVCGASRIEVPLHRGWARVWTLLRALEFHAIKAWFGLPTASLIAFLIGIGCVLAAIGVGLIYSIQTLADFQAIQLWRIEWLLAAVAAFVAGILLKRTESSEK
jgi:hypothetical protein